MWRAKRKRPIGRRILKTFGALVFLCFAFLFLAPYLVNLDRYKEIIIRELGNRFDRRVEISTLQLKTFPRPGLKIEGFRIFDPPNFGNKVTLTAHSLAINVKLLPLLARRLEIDHIKFDRPILVLRRTVEGFNNFSGTQRKPTTLPPASLEPSIAPDKESSPLNKSVRKSSQFLTSLLITNLNIKEAEFWVEDPGLKYPVRLHGINMNVCCSKTIFSWKMSTLKVRNPSKAPIDVEFRGSQPDFLLKAKIGPLNLENIGATPLDGFLTLGNGWITVLKSWLPPRLMENFFDLRQGQLIGDLKIAGTFDQVSLRSRISIGPIMPRGKLLKPEEKQIWTAKFKTSFDWSHLEISDSYKILGDGELSFAGLLFQLSGNGTFGPKKKSFEAQIQSTRLQAEDLQPLIRLILGDRSDQIRIKGLTSLDIQARGGGRKTSITYSLDAKATAVQYANIFRKPLGIPFLIQGKIVSSPGNLEVQDFMFQLRQIYLRGKMAYLKDTLILQAESNPFNLEGMHILFPAIQPFELAGVVRIGLMANGGMDEILSHRSQLKVSLKEVAGTLPNLSQRVRNIQAFVVATPQSVLLTKSKAQIGKTRFEAEGNLSNFNSPQIQFNIRAPYLRLEDILPPSTKIPAVSSLPKLTKASWTGHHLKLLTATGKNRRESGVSSRFRWLESLEGDGNIHVQMGKAAKIRFENLTATLRLSKGKIFAKRFKAQLYGGTLKGQGEYTLIKVPTLFKGRFQLEDISVEHAIADYLPGSDFLSGKLNLKADISGKGISEEALKKTLFAKGNLTLNNGVLSHFGFLEDIERLTRTRGIFGVKNGEKHFQTLNGPFEIKEGYLFLPNLRMTASGISMSSEGRIGFDGESDLIVTVSFDEKATRKVSRGMLLDLLQGEKSKIEIPFHVRGNLRKPKLSLDPKFIQKHLGRNMGKYIIDKLDKLL